MTSKLKSDTARANGAKSRGPKSAAARAKSSRNSLRHGFTARSTILLACEDAALFHQVRDEYIAAYLPATPAESDLVDEMVAARWRIQRIWTIETALLDSELILQRSKPQPHPAAADPGIQLALAFRALADDSRALHLTSRYESRLNRIHTLAHQTLRELQRARKAHVPAQPAQAAPEAPQPRPAAPDPVHAAPIPAPPVAPIPLKSVALAALCRRAKKLRNEPIRPSSLLVRFRLRRPDRRMPL